MCLGVELHVLCFGGPGISQSGNLVDAKKVSSLDASQLRLVFPAVSAYLGHISLVLVARRTSHTAHCPFPQSHELRRITR